MNKLCFKGDCSSFIKLIGHVFCGTEHILFYAAGYGAERFLELLGMGQPFFKRTFHSVTSGHLKLYQVT